MQFLFQPSAGGSLMNGDESRQPMILIGGLGSGEGDFSAASSSGHNRQYRNVPSYRNPYAFSYLGNMLGVGDSSYEGVNYSAANNKSSSWWFLDLNRYNNLAVLLHFINFVVIIILSSTYLNDKPSNIVFVSGDIQLKHTNLALIDINTKQTCRDVRDYSDVYKNEILPFNAATLAQTRHIIDDVLPHNLYDFRNKTLISYDVPNFRIYTYYMISVFFLLSFFFQAINGAYIGFQGNFPRVMHYIEYSISSSLMIMVLAINTGILELYVLVSFFGLFFGMNMLGACAEIISWMTAVLFKNQSMIYGWLLPHLSAWVLFFFTYIPILITFEQTRSCCSVGAPSFVSAAIYVEFALFTIFGLTQTFLLIWRTNNPSADVAYWNDFTSITLSLVAKTFLAWILVAPVLSSR
jgi:hypothetical protein